jgi:hypothetical protein
LEERKDENLVVEINDEKTRVVDSNDGKTQVVDSNEENTQVAERKDENLVVEINDENTRVVDSNDGKTQVVDSNEENTQVAERKDEKNQERRAKGGHWISSHFLTNSSCIRKKRPRCNIMGMKCPNRPVYGYFGASEPTRCKEHKESDMVPKSKMSPTKGLSPTKRKAATPLEGSSSRIQRGKRQIIMSANPHTPCEPKESGEDKTRKVQISRKSPAPDLGGGVERHVATDRGVQSI